MRSERCCVVLKRAFFVVVFSFARVSAVIWDEVAGLLPALPAGEPGWLRLHEKGGKRHDAPPAHHRAAEALEDYLDRCGRQGCS